MRDYNTCSMPRGMAIAAFALILTLPLWAQHGGGGGHGGGGFGGGGHAGGFASAGHVGGFGGGGHAAGFSGGFSGRGFTGNANVHAYSGPLSGASRGYSHLPPTFGFNHPPTGGFTPPTSPLVRQPFASNRFGRNGFGRGFGYNGYGHGGGNVRIRSYPYWGWGYGSWGYPYWGWGYWDPWWSWWWGQDNGDYDNTDYDNNLATAEQMNEDSLRQQQMLQQEQMDGDQDAYYQGADNQGYADAQAQNEQSRPNPYASVRPPLDPERMQNPDRGQTADSTMRPTVLVFRDKHKQEVENYAIVGENLWDFAPQQTVRIPLSELDIPATIRANQDRGITFSVPSPNEGS